MKWITLIFRNKIHRLRISYMWLERSNVTAASDLKFTKMNQIFAVENNKANVIMPISEKESFWWAR